MNTATLTGQRVGPIEYATSLCRDLSRSVAAYRALLGYHADDGHRCAGTRCRLLLPPQASCGGIHLVERPDVDPARPWQVAGGAALEIVVRDADAVADHAATVDDFEIIGGPRPAGATGRLRVVHVRGPDREILYLTRIMPADRPHLLPARPRSLVGRLYSTVLAVADIEQVRDRLRERLGGRPISDRPAALATARLVRGDPADRSYRISSMSIGGGALLELDEIPGVRPAPPGSLAGPVAVALRGPAGGLTLPLDLSDTPTGGER